MQPIDPKDLIGVWNRKSIRWPDDKEDTSSQVWWLQAQPHYADLRIPTGRPSFAGVQNLAQCNATHRAWLATQQGFAGELAQSDRAWLWKREVDYQPPTGKRDIGTLQFTDSTQKFLREDGVDEPYIEIWERVDDAASTNGRALVLRLQNNPANERGMLIALGNHFLIVVDRRTAKLNRDSDPLDMEISHGLRSGPIAEWTVANSTFPWREGEKIFDTSNISIDWPRRTLTESRAWSIIEPTTDDLNWIT